MPSIHNPKPDCSKGHKAQTLCSLPGRQWRGRSRPRPGLQSVSAPSTLIPCGMVRQLRSCPWQAAPTARLGTGHRSHSVSLLMLDQPSFKHHSTQHQAERTPHSTASLPAASSGQAPQEFCFGWNNCCWLQLATLQQFSVVSQPQGIQFASLTLPASKGQGEPCPQTAQPLLAALPALL